MDNFDIPDEFFGYVDMTEKVRPALRIYEPGTEIYLTTTEEKKGLKEDPNHTYRVNNVGHRSDDFETLDNNKINLLFAGCSTTYGEGVKEKYRWTNRVYEELSKDNDLGPLQVLSFPGFGADVIVHNIFKYIDNYGVPDAIFLLIPDYFRYLQYSPQDNTVQPKILIDYRTGTLKEEHSIEELFFVYQRYIRILEVMCKLNNISLYMGTWDSKTDASLKKLQSTSFGTIISDFNKVLDSKYYVDLYQSLPKEDIPFAYDSRDEDHPGILIHEYFAQRFLDRYRYDTRFRE